MKLKDYNTTAKIYELFLQFKEGQFNNSIHGVRYLNKFFNKARLEPTIISSHVVNELALDNNGNSVSEKLTTLKDSIYRECESDLFNGEKFSSIKSQIIFTVVNIAKIPRDLINFNIIMKPRSNSDGGWIIRNEKDMGDYNTKCNEITEDTIYNNKDYVLTVNITTPLNDLMRFSLFFYQKWIDVIESKRLMQEGYKKTLEKYKSTEINKELIDKNKLLNQELSNNKQEIKKLNDLTNAQKIDLTIRDRFIQKLENKQEREINLEFDELISKKDNEIKRLTKENEDFLNLINERDLIIKKQSESLENKNKIIDLEYEKECLEGKVIKLTNANLFLNKENDKLMSNLNTERNSIESIKKTSIEICVENSKLKDKIMNDNKYYIKEKKDLQEKLDNKVKELFELQFLFNLQHETLNDFTSKYLEFKKISEEFVYKNQDLYEKNKYNENLMIAYSNACKEITDNFELIYNYQMIPDIINKHIDKIKE